MMKREEIEKIYGKAFDEAKKYDHGYVMIYPQNHKVEFIYEVGSWNGGIFFVQIECGQTTIQQTEKDLEDFLKSLPWDIYPDGIDHQLGTECCTSKASERKWLWMDVVKKFHERSTIERSYNFDVVRVYKSGYGDVDLILTGKISSSSHWTESPVVEIEFEKMLVHITCNGHVTGFPFAGKSNYMRVCENTLITLRFFGAEEGDGYLEIDSDDWDRLEYSEKNDICQILAGTVEFDRDSSFLSRMKKIKIKSDEEEKDNEEMEKEV